MQCPNCKSRSVREDDPGEYMCNTCGHMMYSLDQMKKVMTALSSDIILTIENQRQRTPSRGGMKL